MKLSLNKKWTKSTTSRRGGFFKDINRNLALLLSGQFVSQIGDKFYLLALSYWVLKTFNSPAKMAVVLACALFPSLLLGFVSGVFIDRFNRKTIIVVTDSIRGVVIAFVAVAYYYGFLSFPIIFVSQILLSINAAFFDPTIPAIIPKMVKEEQLAKVNSMSAFIRGIATIVGPVLAGITVALWGYGFAFIFNAASFLVSAYFESFLKLPGVEGEVHTKTSLKQGIAEGYRYILKTKGLIVILIMVGIIHFFVGSIEVIIPVLADTLAGDGARNLGFLQTAFGGGALLMAALLTVFNTNRKEVQYLFAGVFMVGICLIVIAILNVADINTLVPFLPVFIAIGSFIILAATCFKTILQKSIDDNMAGRVFGVVSSVGNGSIPFAMLIYGFLLSYIDVYHLTLTTGLVLLPLCLGFNWKFAKIGGTGSLSHAAGDVVLLEGTEGQGTCEAEAS
ncbi:MAG: MFS transporter [bacterium]|nr:MFS transporter [bacterium]